VINAQLALKMDQFNQLDNADPFFSPPPPSLLPTDASTSDALALPPLATYPSKEALFEAIQSWAKAHGYAFTVARSKRIKERQKVFYACDRCLYLELNLDLIASGTLLHVVQGVYFKCLQSRPLA